MASDTRDTCPHCDAVLGYVVNGMTYTKAVGVVVPGVYDGALFWTCPYCSGDWHRWGANVVWLHEKAEKAMANRRGMRVSMQMALEEMPAFNESREVE